MVHHVSDLRTDHPMPTVYTNPLEKAGTTFLPKEQHDDDSLACRVLCVTVVDG